MTCTPPVCSCNSHITTGGWVRRKNKNSSFAPTQYTVPKKSFSSQNIGLANNKISTARSGYPVAQKRAKKKKEQKAKKQKRKCVMWDSNPRVRTHYDLNVAPWTARSTTLSMLDPCPQDTYKAHITKKTTPATARKVIANATTTTTTTTTTTMTTTTTTTTTTTITTTKDERRKTKDERRKKKDERGKRKDDE